MKKLLIIPLVLLAFVGCTQASVEENVEEDNLMIYRMYGPSMMPTINEDDILKVEKLNSYERGDIVVFTSPYDSSARFVKRIVGLPGEKVEIIDNYVYVDGEKLDESYLDENSLGKTYSSIDKTYIYKMPENGYFVLGDNRGASTDSRSCFRDMFLGGCDEEDAPQDYITNENIIGKVVN